MSQVSAANRPVALRSVALPTEHGGWGLTLEPALLGLLVAPSAAGWCLAAGALVAFVARTPVKLVLVDRWRGRRLERTALASKVAAGELVVLAALVTGAIVLSDGPFWVPVLIAAPLIGVELWFDMRSRSRRLVPELAGAVAISGVAAMIVTADGQGASLAAGLWLILAARALTSLPFVRAQIARLRGRSTAPSLLLGADLAAVVVATAAVGLERSLAWGAVAVVGVVGVQRVTGRGSPRPPAVLGASQMLLGLGVAVATAAGVLSR